MLGITTLRLKAPLSCTVPVKETLPRTGRLTLAVRPNPAALGVMLAALRAKPPIVGKGALRPRLKSLGPARLPLTVTVPSTGKFVNEPARLRPLFVSVKTGLERVEWPIGRPLSAEVLSWYWL